MQRQLRWAIVGLGQLADTWIAPAISASTTGQLVACVGRDYGHARKFAETHAIELVYPSVDELMKDPTVDAVYVATPNHLHRPVVLSAAAAGKHVLCEKPMALRAAEAEEMVAACERAGVVLRIGLQLRYQQILQAAAATIRGGTLGEVREVSAQRYAPVTQAGSWRTDPSLAGAGALADVGVHVVDFVQWIIGDRIRRVFAVVYPARASGRTDDSATALLEFTGGCLATIRCSRELPVGANDLQVFGTQGMLATGPLRWIDSHRLTVRTPDREEDSDYPADNLYLREVESFADEVSGVRTGAATGEEGLQLVKVTDALLRSLETGSSVLVES